MSSIPEIFRKIWKKLKMVIKARHEDQCGAGWQEEATAGCNEKDKIDFLRSNTPHTQMPSAFSGTPAATPTAGRERLKKSPHGFGSPHIDLTSRWGPPQPQRFRRGSMGGEMSGGRHTFVLRPSGRGLFRPPGAVK